MVRLRAYIQMLWDYFFPARCPVCGSEESGGWCAECLARLVRLRRLPLAKKSPLAECWAAAPYRGAVRELLKQIKYRRRRSNCRFLTELVERSAFAADGFDIVVPVPLHSQRLKQRGYNQTAEIFRPWAELHSLCWQDCLIRQRATAAQYSLTRLERQQNMRGAFAAADEAVLRGRRVLLVDDIFTSGATLSEAARTLRQAGAASVGAFVVASEAD